MGSLQWLQLQQLFVTQHLSWPQPQHCQCSHTDELSIWIDCGKTFHFNGFLWLFCHSLCPFEGKEKHLYVDFFSHKKHLALFSADGKASLLGDESTISRISLNFTLLFTVSSQQSRGSSLNTCLHLFYSGERVSTHTYLKSMGFKCVLHFKACASPLP